ncbi:MAG: succinate--CoA ligase subunit beta [Rickettsiaceae bacterium]|nr:succinate--CoA ligase subunit beta [Rickettsiaceae bacterium]
MNIHEYQAKEVLRKYGVPTSHGVVALKEADIDGVIQGLDSDVYVVKAQIHAGGRGKAGGVKIARSKKDAMSLAHDLYGKTLVTHQTGPSGQEVKRVYIEAGCNIDKEYYFSVVLDTSASRITLMASTEGGVDIEEVAEKHPEIVELRDEGEEDPLEIRARKVDLNYIRMNGSIGCMVNGAGLAMSTMDIIKLYGAEPANFLDVGGGASKESVTEAFKIILSDSSVKGILVNIFGGIMRCDVIAEGVVAAAKEVGVNLPLVVRLAGTNFELGKKILDNSGLKIIVAEDLGDAADKIVKAI